MQNLMPAMQDLWQNLVKQFTATFITEQRYMLFLNGLKTTLTITFCAALLGIVLGFLIAYCRTTYERTLRRGPLLKFLNFLCNVYLTVIRGTPTMIQVLIMYFVIFGSVKIDKVPVAVLAFGMNSGAYVAEIFRAGILAVDKGQTEAARSLGLSSWQSMRLVVLPQAIKNVLPALANEVVTMVKESSICSVLGMAEIMYTAQTVSGNSYITLAPYVLAAIIYFCINYPASKAIEAIERRMRRGDKQ